MPVDYTSHRDDATDWRDTRLVDKADAAVLVGESNEVRGLFERVEAKTLRLVALGNEPRPDKARKPTTSPEEERPKYRGLPD